MKNAMLGTLWDSVEMHTGGNGGTLTSIFGGSFVVTHHDFYHVQSALYTAYVYEQVAESPQIFMYYLPTKTTAEQ